MLEHATSFQDVVRKCQFPVDTCRWERSLKHPPRNPGRTVPLAVQYLVDQGAVMDLIDLTLLVLVPFRLACFRQYDNSNLPTKR